MGGGITPIIKKLNKKNVITYRIAYNYRCSRGFDTHKDL
jgi:hypothetical protein